MSVARLHPREDIVLPGPKSLGTTLPRFSDSNCLLWNLLERHLCLLAPFPALERRLEQTSDLEKKAADSIRTMIVDVPRWFFWEISYIATSNKAWVEEWLNSKLRGWRISVLISPKVHCKEDGADSR
ncbi:hypothetical protein TNIN_204361 [Trichonephila inaurata madagascariensis]|uniref:Uncharacterized protein n=1 Tax=Trichonephila inaurata madagascariensis TaxID=2747483 RepID=A0A8X6WPQ5_9ARAC|nr:hypothetical protein TNIN_204361 [Trichonephila inaurata madagascariensis]